MGAPETAKMTVQLTLLPFFHTTAQGEVPDGFTEFLIRQRTLVNQKSGNLTVERFLAGMFDRISFLADRHP